ncbi:MAG: DUF6690 family protein [Pirellulales bacterium]
MIKRHLLMITALSAAVGVPVLISGDGDQPNALTRMWNSVSGGDKPATSAIGTLPFSSAGSPIGAVGGGALGGSATLPPGTIAPEMLGPRIDGHPAFDPGEVFRFDVSPAWIMGRWARVTTIPLPPELEGYRVPLVTGPTEHDLAGSLTYYFSAKQEVQRITFVGTTGDPAALVRLLMQRFKFAAFPSSSPGEYLYQIRWHNQPRSEMVLRMSDVVRADMPLRRFDVDLEINLPDVPPSKPLQGGKPPRST